LKLRGGETYGKEGRTEVGVTSANLAEKRAGDRAKETYFNVINLVLEGRYENTWKREGCISLKKRGRLPVTTGTRGAHCSTRSPKATVSLS